MMCPEEGTLYIEGLTNLAITFLPLRTTVDSFLFL